MPYSSDTRLQLVDSDPNGLTRSEGPEPVMEEH